jgi:hypothetical protein
MDEQQFRAMLAAINKQQEKRFKDALPALLEIQRDLQARLVGGCALGGCCLHRVSSVSVGPILLLREQEQRRAEEGPEQESRPQECECTAKCQREHAQDEAKFGHTREYRCG